MAHFRVAYRVGVDAQGAADAALEALHAGLPANAFAVLLSLLACPGEG